MLINYDEVDNNDGDGGCDDNGNDDNGLVQVHKLFKNY